MTDNVIKYLHYRMFSVHDGKPLARRGATVAYVVGENGISYSIAYCGPHDNYNKAYGRIKAAGRLLSRGHALSDKTPEGFIKWMDTLMLMEEGYSRRGKTN